MTVSFRMFQAYFSLILKNFMVRPGFGTWEGNDIGTSTVILYQGKKVET